MRGVRTHASVFAGVRISWSRIFAHDPICVRDCEADCGSPVYFCNYACHSVYIDESSLTAGDACELTPGDSECC
ncbi:hypothetical protein [Haloplanus aerogenes]|uniref:hypothetical protein n=1 Tax=Haloplanus aerogenes TaxID=660522 RepID=UPI0037436BBF